MEQFKNEPSTEEPFRKLADCFVPDAKRLLQRFEDEGVRFRIRDRCIRDNTSDVGPDSWIEVYTHRDDETKVRKVLDEICKV